MAKEQKPELSLVVLGDPGQDHLLRSALSTPSFVPHLTADAVDTYSRALQDLDCPIEDVKKSAKKLADQEPVIQVAVAYTARIAASNRNGNGVSSKRHRK